MTASLADTPVSEADATKIRATKAADDAWAQMTAWFKKNGVLS